MKPLSGVRILEIDGLGPITFAGMMLADMGADVLRLTRTGASGAFEDVGGAVTHRGRPAVPVDLKSPADRDAVLALVEKADALVEGFRPGVMERLGLGPDACQARNPRLTYARITGWGQTGPLADQVGHDINYLALSGMLHALGEPDRPPRAPLNLVADYAGGAMPVVIGILSGVIQARATGRGPVVDAAMVDGAGLLSALFQGLAARGLWQDQRGANLLDGGAPFYRCYACADGGHVAVGALEPRFYAALLAGLDIAPSDAPQYDFAGWPALHQRFAEIFGSRPRDHWASHFAGTEACVTPVLNWAEAQDHPHNVARGLFTGQSPRQPGPAPRFGGDAGLPEEPGPLADVRAALTRWGG